MTTPFEKTIQLKNHKLRVWHSAPLYEDGKNRVCISINSYDIDLCFSAIISFDNEQQAAQLADAITTALGHAWHKEL